jgi:hypothetical protein
MTGSGVIRRRSSRNYSGGLRYANPPYALDRDFGGAGAVYFLRPYSTSSTVSLAIRLPFPRATTVRLTQ